MEIALFLIPLALVAVIALALNAREARNTFDVLTADETDHSARLDGSWADRSLDAAATGRPNHSPEAAAYALSSQVQNNIWETSEGMPDPDKLTEGDK